MRHCGCSVLTDRSRSGITDACYLVCHFLVLRLKYPLFCCRPIWLNPIVIRVSCIRLNLTILNRITSFGRPSHSSNGSTYPTEIPAKLYFCRPPASSRITAGHLADLHRQWSHGHVLCKPGEENRLFCALLHRDGHVDILSGEVQSR